MNNMGHNTGGVSGERLKSLIMRIERLNQEKDDLGQDIKEIFVESKSLGFDTKIMRKIIKLRKKDSQARKEEEELTDLYMSAIGMDTTPLGMYAASEEQKEFLDQNGSDANLTTKRKGINAMSNENEVKPDDVVEAPTTETTESPAVETPSEVVSDVPEQAVEETVTDTVEQATESETAVS